MKQRRRKNPRDLGVTEHSGTFSVYSGGGSSSELSINLERLPPQQLGASSSSLNVSKRLSMSSSSEILSQHLSSSSSSSFKNTPLMARTSITRSKSGAEVMEELQRLKFSDMPLYGRKAELDFLHKAFARFREGSNQELIDTPQTMRTIPEGTNENQEQLVSNFIIIQGHSGQGKSALAKEFQRQLSKAQSPNKLLFASGKIDQPLHHTTTTPFSAFVTAFAQLCRSLGHDETALLDALGQDSNLHHLMPNNIAQEVNRDEQQTMKDAASASGTTDDFDVVKLKNRFEYAIKAFLLTICTCERPVILFLDDLQWADQASLDLITLILTDPQFNNRILVIVAYRPNQVENDEPLAKTLEAIENMRKLRIQQIVLSDLSFRHVHDYVTDLLNSTHGETKELAQICEKKCHGNPFSLNQFLAALRDRGLLDYSIGVMKWTWDTNIIRQNAVVSGNVLSYLIQKMGDLPDSRKRLLVILACLGSRFEQQVCVAIYDGLQHSAHLPGERGQPESSTPELLQALEEDGLIERFEGGQGQTIFCFAHDQIQLAAQSLQEYQSTRSLKLEVAKLLYDIEDNIDFGSNLFLMVDLWNESHDIGQDYLPLMQLNLQAGKHALDMAAFAAAIHYCRTGLSLVPVKPQWTVYYDSTIALYNCLIRAEFSSGAWETLNQDIEIVLSRPTCPILDKTLAYAVQITFLSSQQNKHSEAILLAVSILKKLGVTFRPELGKLAIIGALLKTKLTLKKYPLESIYQQPMMDDRAKEAATNILTSVQSSLYAADPDLYITSVLKIVRWSLKYGTTKHTSRCIGVYGLVVMAMGNIESGTDACKVAVELSERQGLFRSEYAPVSSAYGFVFPWTQPLQNCQRQLYDSYNIGLLSGDMEYAMMNITLYGFFCYSTGKSLPDLEKDMRDYARQMEECNMILQLHFLKLTWQTILNLMGRCDNPVYLNGEAMDQNEMLQHAKHEKNPPLKAQLYCHQLQLAVYFGDFELAASILHHTRVIGTVNPVNPIIWRTALFEGIAAFELMKRGKMQWKLVANKSLKKVKGWVDVGNPNCVHILHLLEAEKISCNGLINDAKRMYDKSIALSARNGFRNDRALAAERCAAMFDKEKNRVIADEYYRKALDVYVELGAHGKVVNMQERKAQRSFSNQ